MGTSTIRASEAAIAIVVNGEDRSLAAATSLAELVAQLGLADRKVAVAVNREVVPRSELSDRTLADGDRVEILEAVGGG